MNGDGVADIAVTALRSPARLPTGDRRGEIHVVSGTQQGIFDLATDCTVLTVFGGDNKDHLGSQITTGDINRDGIADVVVSAVDADGPGNMRPGSGEVHIFLGSREAPDAESLRTIVMALTEDVFKGGLGHKAALLSLIRRTAIEIELDRLNQARIHLETARRHVDGCGKSADNDDWILNCAAQVAIRCRIEAMLGAPQYQEIQRR